MNFHTIPKFLIRQKKECRHDHKLDGTEQNFKQLIQEHALAEEKSDIDENANVYHHFNY
jgi:hypothetical protein